MNTLTTIIEITGWTLLHFVWQGTALAAALWVFLRLVRRAGPQVRYAAAGVALLGMAGAVAGTAVWLAVQGNGTERSHGNEGNDGILAVPVPAVRATGQPPSIVQPHVSHAAPASYASTPPALAPAAPAVRAAAAQPPALLPWGVGIWAAGVVFFSVRLLLGWRTAQQWRRAGSADVPEEWRARFSGLCQTMGLTRPVQLLSSAVLRVPVVIGWLRPVVLVPASLLTGLPGGQLHALLAHELAHVRRHDYLVNLLQSLAGTLLFYHPAVWWVSSVMRREREHCCDDTATAVCGGALDYARALTALEEFRTAPALSAAAGPLLQRIRRLAGVPEERASVWPVVLLIAGSLCLIPLLKAGDESLPEKAPAAEPAPKSSTAEIEAALKRLDAEMNPFMPLKPEDPAPSSDASVSDARDEAGKEIPVEYWANTRIEDIYLKGYQTMLEGDKLIEEDKPREALKRYKLAQLYFQKAADKQPDWNPDMLTFRLRKIAETINKASEKFAKELELSAPAGGEETKQKRNETILNVKEDGRVVLDGKTYTLAELKAPLEALAKEDKKQAVVIWAEKEQPVEHIIKVLDAAHKAGLYHVSFATQRPEEAPPTDTDAETKKPPQKNDAQPAGRENEDGMRRATRRSGTTLTEETFSRTGELILKRIFQTDSKDRLRNGVIYDGKGQPRGSIFIGYDRKTGKPMEEQQFNQKGRLVRRLFYPGTLPNRPDLAERFMALNYDPDDARAKPVEQLDALPTLPVEDEGELKTAIEEMKRIEEELKMTLPGNADEQKRGKELSVEVKADGTMGFEGKAWKPAELQERLKELNKAGEIGVVTIRAGTEVPWEVVASFMGGLDKVGISQVTFSVPEDERAATPVPLAKAEPGISLTVKDSSGQKAVGAFRVIAGVPSSLGGTKEVIVWQPHTLREGKDGGLVWPLGKAYEKMALRVEADGFEPQVFSWIEKARGAQDLFFQLKEARGMPCQVVTPDGKPAVDAVVTVALVQRDAVLEGGKLRTLDMPQPKDASDRWRRPPVWRTDANGSVLIPNEPDSAAVLLVTHERGVSEMTLKDFQEFKPGTGVTVSMVSMMRYHLKLRPWAKVSGKVLWGEKPGAGLKVTLGAQRDEYGYPGIVGQYETTLAGADGSFTFERVLPGLVQLSCPIATGKNKDAVEANFSGRILHKTLQPGDNSALIGGAGRTVKGRLTGRADWTGVTFHFHPTAPHVGMPGDDTMWKAWSAWQQSADGPLFFRNALTVKADGTFEIPGVLPGHYQIFFTGPDGKAHIASSQFSFEHTQQMRQDKDEPVVLPDLVVRQ